MEKKFLRIIIVLIFCIVVIFSVNFFLSHLNGLQNFIKGKSQPPLRANRNLPRKTRNQEKITTGKKLEVFKVKKKATPQLDNEGKKSHQDFIQKEILQFQIPEDDFLLQ